MPVTEIVVPISPTLGSLEGDNYFSQSMVDGNEAAEVFDDSSMLVVALSDTIEVL